MAENFSAREPTSENKNLNRFDLSRLKAEGRAVKDECGGSQSDRKAMAFAPLLSRAWGGPGGKYLSSCSRDAFAVATLPAQYGSSQGQVPA